MFKRLVDYASRYPVHAAVGGAALMIVGLYWVGGALVINGLVAGLLLSAVFGILLWKVKSCEHPIIKRIYAQIALHPILSDIGITMLAFAVSPAGITSWIAASVCGLLTSVWLLYEHHVVKERELCPTQT